MIQVFKCDHCHHFTQDAEEMRMHEVKCVFNEANKKCFTCLHSYEAGMPISAIQGKSSNEDWKFWNDVMSEIDGL